eukprot:Protomagalhaensia_sp_Gyna_25__447@NODE_1210_length_2067_cov_575_761341_g963_i0_p3_GENE_NODE_1210_length_2067_cov_575_761341_g963_i0NODE_1210_length_2067_cov_575_761341_g963_i0_p3_ORF_typecomplete_len186_score51_19Histone/PF00125_24/6_6e07Histone/PF00125_24/1_1e03CBFD_NFYB_HMF/PF00808_23/4_6e06_NODE_1210_length_2067_cov_575_761341_g963_i06931250
MAGAKRATTKPASKSTATKHSAAVKANLKFPPNRFQRLLKRGRHTNRVSASCSVFLAGAMEWFVAELLDVMVEAATKSKSSMLHPRHVMGAILNDEELSTVFNNIVILKGGMGTSNLGIQSCFGGKAHFGVRKMKKKKKLESTQITWESLKWRNLKRTKRRMKVQMHQTPMEIHRSIELPQQEEM